MLLRLLLAALGAVVVIGILIAALAWLTSLGAQPHRPGISDATALDSSIGAPPKTRGRTSTDVRPLLIDAC
jgi:hypothetical protein